MVNVYSSGIITHIIGHTYSNTIYSLYCPAYQSQQFPSHHNTQARCWFNVGPSSATLAQNLTDIGSVYRVAGMFPGGHKANTTHRPNVEPMLGQRRTLVQHWVDVLCLLGSTRSWLKSKPINYQPPGRFATLKFQIYDNRDFTSVMLNIYSYVI